MSANAFWGITSYKDEKPPGPPHALSSSQVKEQLATSSSFRTSLSKARNKIVNIYIYS